MAGPAGPAIAVSGAGAAPPQHDARVTLPQGVTRASPLGRAQQEPSLGRMEPGAVVQAGGPAAVAARTGSRHIGQNGVPSGRWKGSATW